MTQQMTRMMLAGAVVLGSVLLGSTTTPGTAVRAAAGPAGTLPVGLPTHVLLGLGSGPGDLGWMTASGVPWDARYQYLSGGVNTGSGWATWNSPAGAFALWYMQNSGSSGYLPVFSYYQMLQSSPASGATEGDKDYNNLNNPATMSAYYADFKLLMAQAHAYGKPVIVHVEPDLWGYMEQKAGSCGKASCVSASVASSGYTDVATYPNTVQGFAEALLHLRDLYAPNVVMAIHATCWGSGADVCNYPSSLADTAAHAAQDGAFLSSAGISGNQAGTSSWDLVFTDTSDRDAGYYQYVYGNNHTWWDPTNTALPNFANFRTWVAGVNAGTGRRIVLWQTPLGNQYFDTENNTDGHYQDNRAQYFLSDGPTYAHLSDFANAGVVGVLFGAGAGGPTTYTDAKGDGITNPAPVSAFQCNLCNTHVSQYSDDDGGYMRLFGGNYLNVGGVPVPLAGVVPTPTSTTGGPTATPAPATTTPVPATNTPAPLSVAVNSTAATPADVAPDGTENLAAIVVANKTLSNMLIDIEVYDAAGTKVYQTAQSPVTLPANMPQTFNAIWAVPASQAAGTYTLKIGVFDTTWATLYAWDNAGAMFSVGTAPATNTSVPATPTQTPAPPSATPTRTPVPPSATSTPGNSTSKLGYTGIGTSLDSGDANWMNGSRIVVGARSETVTSVSAYVGLVDSAPYKQFDFAFYTDTNGAPGTLVAQSAAGTLTANSWNTLPLSANLRANSAYWLLYNTNGSKASVNNMAYTGAASNVGVYSNNAQRFGSWPGTFGSATLGGWRYSLYTTVSP